MASKRAERSVLGGTSLAAIATAAFTFYAGDKDATICQEQLAIHAKEKTRMVEFIEGQLGDLRAVCERKEEGQREACKELVFRLEESNRELVRTLERAYTRE